MTTRKIKLFSGARKHAKATATISNGTGRVTVNNVPVEIIEPRLRENAFLFPWNSLTHYVTRSILS